MKKTSLIIFISAVILTLPFFVSAATLGEIQAQINALMAQVQALMAQLQLLQGQTSSTSFTCGSSLTDSRDSKTYRTLQIGNQCWMKENLNIGAKINGSSNQANNSVIEKYCFNNDESKCASEGGLYQWDEAMGYSANSGVQGICPSGWHVPTDTEFCNMAKAVDSSVTCDSTGYRGSNAGTKLKVGGSSGFEGIFAGVRDPAMGTSIFYDRGSSSSFWTSSTSTDNNARKWSLNSSLIGIGRYGATKTSGFSVRCVKDVDASVSANLSITTSPFLDPATQNSYYSKTISATTVSGSYAWSATGLPAGLSLPPASGASAEIKGTPTVSGSFTITVTASAGGKTDSETFYLTVNSNVRGVGGGIATSTSSAGGTGSSGFVSTSTSAGGASSASLSGAGDKEERTCVDKYCYGQNSKLLEVRNRDDRSNSALGAVCCDGNWSIDARGSYWISYCNNAGSASTYYSSQEWHQGFDGSDWYVCATGVAAPTGASSGSPSVIVSSPTQGESYNAGSKAFVHWTITGFSVPLYDLTVDISLVPENSLTGNWSGRTWNDGTEQWPIGEFTAPGKYYIKVRVCEPSDLRCVQGNSQVFTVVGAGISTTGGVSGKTQVACSFPGGSGECSGNNSVITGIGWNGADLGSICCDGAWRQKAIPQYCSKGYVCGADWEGDCNGMGNGFQQGGFYQCRNSSSSVSQSVSSPALVVESCECTVKGFEVASTTSCTGNRKGTYTKVQVCDGCHWNYDSTKTVDRCLNECLDGFNSYPTPFGVHCTSISSSLLVNPIINMASALKSSWSIINSAFESLEDKWLRF